MLFWGPDLVFKMGRSEALMTAPKTYLPAAGYDLFLPLYDPFVKLLGGETARQALLDRANLQPGFRILDIGCGTGTLAVNIKRTNPAVEVVGIDPDPKALARAQNKAARAATNISFDQGFANKLPYPDRSFDRVFSSFMFHHLPGPDRESSLCEVARVLKPTGEFHMMDFAATQSGIHGLLSHFIHSSGTLRDNAENRVLHLMSRVGLARPEKIASGTLLFGHIAYYRALAPPAATA
jgi:ubiquinone/menaquinone biosynthesis C-methylase UbiE